MKKSGPVPHNPGESPYLKQLVHGIAGNGKTTYLGTAQEDDRTYPMAFLNFEAGEKSLVGLDIDVYDIHGWQDYNEVYAMLLKSGEYRSVGVDSVTETQVSGLLEILEKDGKRPDPDQLAEADWGLILVQMRRFVRHFKFLPMHVFMTALTKDATLPRVGTVKVPAVQGSFGSELPGMFDVVSYMATEDVEVDDAHPDGVGRLMLMHSNPKFSVKCRTPWGQTVPSEIEDPTIGVVMDVLGYQMEQAA